MKMFRCFVLAALSIIAQGVANADDLVLSKADFHVAYANQPIAALMRTQHTDHLAALELARRFSIGSSDTSSNSAAALKFYSQAASRARLPGEASVVPVDQLLVPVIRASRVGDFSSPPDSLAANFELTIEEGTAPFQLSVDGAALTSSTAVHYAWSFGDGRVGSGAQQSVVYEEAGVFGISLTVMDQHGQLSSIRRELTVTAPALPPMAPTLSEPVDYSVVSLGTAISVVWSPVIDAEAYRLQLIDPSDNILFDSGGQTAVCNESLCEYLIETTGLQAGDLVLRLKASNESGDSPWAERTITLLGVPYAPVINSPLAGSVLATSVPFEVSWSQLSNADTYEAEVRGGSGSVLLSTGLLEAENVCSDNDCTYLIDNNGIGAGAAILALRALNSAGESIWTEQSVTFVDAPLVPVIEVPLANAQFPINAPLAVSWIAAQNNESFELELVGDDNTPVYLSGNISISSACDGLNCEHTIDSAALIAGSYSLRLRSFNIVGVSEWVGVPLSLIAEPSTPVLLTPTADANVVVNSALEVSWQTSVGASGYELELVNALSVTVATTGVLAAGSVCAAEGCDQTLSTDGLSGGAYTLRLRANNAVGESEWTSRLINLLDAAGAPVITAPEADAVFALNASINVNWTAVENADSYRVELLDAMDTVVVDAGVLTSTDSCDVVSCGTTIDTAGLSVGGYTLRLRSTNAVGESEWTTRPISLLDAADAPVITAPDVEAVFALNASIVVSWTSVENANSYRVELLDATDTVVVDAGVLTSADSCDADGCSAAIDTAGLLVGAYSLQVRSVNVLGESDWTTRSIALLGAADVPVISAPDADSVFALNTSIDVYWTSVENADSYRVELLDATDTAVRDAGVLTSADTCDADGCSAAIDTAGLLVGAYTLQVRSVNVLGESDWSTRPIALLGAADVPVISAPDVDSVFALNTSIDVYWTSVENADSYRVELLDATDTAVRDAGVLTSADTCDADGCSAAIDTAGLLVGAYTLQVRSVNVIGESEWATRSIGLLDTAGTPVITTPDADSVFALSVSIDVSWASVENADSYRVELLDATDVEVADAGVLTAADSCDADACSVAIDTTGLSVGAYSLQVRSVNVLGESEWATRSISLLDTAGTPVITAPDADAVFALNASIDVSWASVENADSFRVELLDATDTVVADAGVLTSTDSCDLDGCSTAIDTAGLSVGAYSLQVRSVNVLGESEWATRAVGLLDTAGTPVITAPDADAVFALNASIDVNWTSVENADGYHVELLDATDTAVRDAGVLTTADSCDAVGCSTAIDTAGLLVGEYTLRLRSANAVGESDWTTRAIALAGAADAPVITAPDADSVFALNALIDVNWTSVENADSYRVELLDASDTAVADAGILISADNCDVDGCSTALDTAELTAGAYTLRLRSANAVGESDWTTQPIGLLDTAGAPVITAPDAYAVFPLNASIDVNWTEVENADSYRVELLDAADSVVRDAGVLTSADSCDADGCSTAIDTAELAVGAYTLRLRSANAVGESEWTTRAVSLLDTAGTPVITAPDADTVFAVNASIDVSWTSVENADSYRVELLDATDTVTVDAGILTAADSCDSDGCSTAIDTAELSVGAYTLRLRAANAVGESEWTTRAVSLLDTAGTPVITAPDADAVFALNASIDVSWTSVENADNYRVELLDGSDTVAVDAGILTAADSCDADGCSTAIDTAELSVGAFSIRVRSTNAVGESEWTTRSISLLDAAGAPVINSPEADEVFALNASIDVNWTAVENADSYRVELLDATDTVVVDAGILTSVDACDADGCSTAIDTAELPVGAYTLQVRSVNGLGESEWATRSIVLLDTAGAPVITAPDADAVFPLNASIDVNWTEVENADSYRVELLDATDTVVVDAGVLTAADNCTADACSTAIDTTGLSSGTYSLQVRSVNGLGESESTELGFLLATAPESPILSMLENAAAGGTATVTWLPVESAELFDFELVDQDDTVQAGPVSVDHSSICNAEACTFTLDTTNLSAGDYVVRVRAVNTVGQSEWSLEPLRLVDVPLMPVNLTPVENEELIYLNDATFTWAPVDDAEKYEFHTFNSHTGELAWIRDMEPSDYCVEGGNCSVTTAVELPVSPYHAWRVRAWNVAGWGPYSRSLFSMIDPENLIDDPPEAVFSSSAETGAVPFYVSFDATESSDDGQIVDYHWTIGDELEFSGAELLSVEHTFNVVGPVTITLTVTDDAGMTHTSSREIVATENFPPIASFNLLGYDEYAAGLVPLSLQFDPEDSTDDDTLTEFRWNFGDGSDIVTTPSAVIQTHQYTSTGEYTVELQVDDILGQTDSFSRTVQVIAASNEPVLDDIDAARLLTQATFGPTLADINQVTSLGVETWLDIQLSRLEPPHLDYVYLYSNGSNREARHEIWWKRVVEGQDQLRERVAFALSQIFVVSDIGHTLGNGQYGVTNYYDMLRTHAFGNYRDLLEAVTLSPVMGTYLSMLQNSKGDELGGTRADENFAREVLQLFSIGLTELNIDGSSTGIPTFTQEIIEDFARVFTGWNYKDAGQWNRNFFDGPDRVSPMEPFEEYHDTGQKTLLNGAVAAEGLSARDDLNFALDNIFNHPNVGPFIGKQLIMRLVTSNPSPDYVQRVAVIFNDNGSGVRGDLGAVVKAILTDPEARQITGAAYGKLREPVLRLAHLWRAFNITPGAHGGIRGDYNTYSPATYNIDFVTGQAVLKSPSVFNFYKPEYAPQGLDSTGTMVAPEFEIMTAGNEIATTNRIGDQINRHYLGTPHVSDLNPSFLDFTTELTLAHDADLLLDHLDLLLTNGGMSVELRSLLTQHIEGLATTDEGLSQRVRDAVTLIMASPDYLVQM